MDRQALIRALLGQGMVGQAADAQKLYPIYQQEMQAGQINGQQPIPFDIWKQQRMTQPMQAMPEQ